MSGKDLSSRPLLGAADAGSSIQSETSGAAAAIDEAVDARAMAAKLARERNDPGNTSSLFVEDEGDDYDGGFSNRPVLGGGGAAVNRHQQDSARALVVRSDGQLPPQTGVARGQFEEHFISDEMLDEFWPAPSRDGPEDVVLDAIKKKDKVSKRGAFSWRACGRVKRVVGLAFNRRCCCGKMGVLATTAAIFTMIAALGNSSIFIFAGIAIGAMADNDAGQFYTACLLVAGAGVVSAVFANTARLMSGYLAIYARENITRILHYRYFRSKMYYRLNTMDRRVDNPDQRICEDPRLVSAEFFDVLYGSLTHNGIFYSLTSIVALGYFTIVNIGLWGMVGTFVFTVISFGLTKWFMNGVTPLIFRQDRLEGEFRFAHIHARENAESIVFFEGQDQTHKQVNAVLRRALINMRELVVRYVPLNFVQVLVSNVALLLGILIPAFIFRSVGLPGGSEANTEGNFAQVYPYMAGLISSVGGIFSLADPFANLIGYGNRVGEFLEVLDDLEAQEQHRILQFSCSDNFVSLGNFHDARYVAMQGVTCATPENLVLVKDLSFRVNEGDSLIVIGPSGVGKSSVLRVLGGLWPSTSGNIYRPSKIGRGGIFYVPQRSYLAGGSLKSQIVYPLAEADAPLSDEEMRDLLSIVNLEHIVAYEEAAALHHLEENTATGATSGPAGVGSAGSNAGHVEWSKVLSGGEQQRLAMVRLLYHRPNIAILDECTSNVDAAVEATFYSHLRDLGIACISVAHREGVRRFHDNALILMPRGRWRIVPTAELPERVVWDALHDKFFTSSFVGRSEMDRSVSLPSLLDDAGAFTRHHISDPLPEDDYGATQFFPLREEAAESQAPVAFVASEQDSGCCCCVNAPHAVRWHLRDQPETFLDGAWKHVSQKKMRGVLEGVESKEATKRKSRLNVQLLRRVRRLIGIMFGGWCSTPALQFYASVLCCLIVAGGTIAMPFAQTFLAENALVISVEFYYAMLLVVGIVLGVATAQTLNFFASGLANVHLRRNIARMLHFRFLRDRMLYAITNLDGRLDNPDQRVVQDSREFTQLFVSLCFGEVLFTGIFVNVPVIIINSVLAYQNVTWRGLAIAYGLAVVSGVLSKLLMNPIVPLVFRQDRFEGDFRFAHVRLRTYAESVAFLSGGNGEHALHNDELRKVLANQRLIVIRRFFLGMWVNIDGYLPAITGFLLPGLIYFTGNAPPGTDPNTFFLAVYFQYSALYGAAHTLFQLVDIVSAWAGHGNRLADFCEVMDDLEERFPPAAYRVSASAVEFDGVDIIRPDGVRLVSNLSMGLAEGGSVLIRGPSGAGKSSILRTLGGLWTAPKGTITRPRPGPGGIFFMPQTPLIVLGSLKAQLVYPTPVNEARLDDEEMVALLRRVRLDYLLDRVYSGASENDQANQTAWADLLSGGEKQRLSMARMFYNKPRFAILDESLSALDGDMREAIYNQMHEMGISYISVSHHPQAAEHHDFVIELDGTGAWRLIDNRAEHRR